MQFGRRLEYTRVANVPKECTASAHIIEKPWREAGVSRSDPAEVLITAKK
jgi:hypothetical protein